MMAGCKGKAHGHQNGRELQPQVQGIRTELWTSLVAQWLRIYLPMQGTQVRSLVQEDPTCLCAATTDACEPRAHALQQESHSSEKPAHCN